MHIDWWTLGIQTVNVLVLVFVLGRFLFRPVTAIVEARRAAATKLLDDARAAREAADAERDQARKDAADLARARTEALAAAAGEAETEKQSILAAAREEAERLRAAAETAIAREREEAAEAASARASRLAIEIAARLLERLPDEARVAGFVDGLARSASDLPEAVRATMGAGGAPIRLTAPRPLTAAEEAACRDRLSRALGRPVTIAAAVDPSLIAGLEIDMPHATVRNSFRADLERITAALVRDERRAP